MAAAAPKRARVAMLEAPLPLIPPPAGGARRCTGCSCALAPDQRYCVRCGAPAEDVAWAPAHGEALPPGEADTDAESAPGLPAPRSTALLALLVLAVGVFIGGAFGPRSPDTLADDSDSPVVVVAGNAPAPVRPVSPAGDSGSSAFGGEGAATATASAAGTATVPAAASPVPPRRAPPSPARICPRVM